jgi:hypothetical protein
MITIVILALVGVVISMIVGTLWHMPQSPMGRLHMRYIGFDTLSPEEQKQKMEEGKAMMPKIYGGQAVLSLLMSFAVVYIVTLSMQNGMGTMAAIGFVAFNWLCFMVPVVGGNILWGNCDRAIAWKKFFSDAGYQLVTVVIIALVTSWFV